MEKLTPKQERFCQMYIETGNATEAYRLSYNAENMKATTIMPKASKMLIQDKIEARIKSLQQVHQQRHMITVENLTERLTQAEMLAHEERHPGAVVSAVMGIARIHGCDKQIVSNDPENPLPSAINIIIVDK